MISFLLKDVSNNKTIISKNSNLSLNTASLAKVFYALEVLDRLDKNQIFNKSIRIQKKDIEGYGTDVLNDIVCDKNIIELDLMSLVGLMLKYSCNSSTKLIVSNFLGDRKLLQNEAIQKWNLSGTQLVDKRGNIEAKFSIDDLSNIFSRIYEGGGKNWLYAQNKLKESRNIYYLLDQKEVNVLGSKSGTVNINGIYWVSNCAMFQIGEHIYFIGAVVSNKHISKAVQKIRQIGKALFNNIRIK
jgi:hypothetical protein